MNYRKYTPYALYGFVLVLIGVFAYTLGVVMGPIRILLNNPDQFRAINEVVVWYSGIPIIIGVLLICYDLFSTVRQKRKNKTVRYDVVKNHQVTAVLTAYNDELSIAEAVKDFIDHPLVKRVIVISNNSSDNTMKYAEEAGAIVYDELKQGYGSCVFRALSEGVKYDDTELVLLCEGDCTFKAYDIEKFLSYIHHADIVNGTRIVEQLQDNFTQLSMFMHYGNLFVGKLLEVKHLGDVTLTDVGTTYKLCRKEALLKLLPILNNNVNLEFNPYFIDKAVFLGMDVLECPITFHPRVGVSKGGNINNSVALKLGVRMIFGILFNWINSTKK